MRAGLVAATAVAAMAVGAVAPDSVAAYLRSRELVLVLDNVEQVRSRRPDWPAPARRGTA